MSISNYLEEKILNKVFSNTDFTVSSIYVSLHTADPGETGASEVTGGSYVRKVATCDAAANPAGTTQHRGNIQYTSMPAVTVTHVGLWDASSGVNFLWGGSLVAPKTLNSGDTFQINTGDLDITLD